MALLKPLVMFPLLLASTQLFAADDGGLGFVSTNVRYQQPSEFTGTVTMRAIGLNVVGEITPGWNYETLIFTGLSSGEIQTRSSPIEISLKRGAAVYLRPSLKLGDRVALFSRLGYASSTLEASYRGVKVSDSDSGASFGVGVDFSLNQKASITLDFTEFYDKDGARITGFTVGARYRM